MNNEPAENVINIAKIGLICVTVSSPTRLFAVANRRTSLDVDTTDGGELFRVTRMLDEVLHKIDRLGRIPFRGSFQLAQLATFVVEKKPCSA